MSRIVVVDDHPVFRKGLIALLRVEGHEVVAEASDGVEAVTVVAAELPDRASWTSRCRCATASRPQRTSPLRTRASRSS